MEYAVNDSKTIAPTSGWSLEMPKWERGIFIWQRIKVTYSVGNPSYTTPHCLESNIIDDVTNNIGEITFRDKTEILSGTEIFTDKADDNSVVHVEVDGKSVGVGNNNLLSKGDIQSWNVTTTWNGDVSVIETPSTGGLRIHHSLFDMSKEYVLGFKAKLISGTINGIRGHSSSFNTIAYQDDVLLGAWLNNVTAVDKPLTVGVISEFKILFNKKAPTDDWLYIQPNRSAYGEPFKVELFDFQINEGSALNKYEGLKPTPSHPVEIHSLNDVDVVSSVGYNNQFLNTDFKNGLTHWKITNADGGYQGNEGWSIAKGRYAGLEQSIPHYESLKGHVLYGRVELKSDSQSSYFVFFNDGFAQVTRSASPATFGNFTALSAVSTINDEAKHIYCKIQDARTEGWTENRIRNLYILDLTEIYGKGNEPTQAEMDALFKDKWAPSIFDITEDGSNHPLIDKINLLLDEPLRSVGDIKDRLFRDIDGLWKVERNIGVSIINGSESWLEYGTTEYKVTNRVYYSIPLSGTKLGYQTSITSHLINKDNVWASNNTDYYNYSDHPTTRNKYFRLPLDVSLDEWKNWLSENPVTFQGQLANPVMETLPQSLQDKLNNLRTFKDSNYLYTVLPDKSNILSENLKPTLHATFKSIAWANDFRYKFEQSKAMHATDIWFAKGVSNTIAPNIGWSTDAPVWEDGLYIWSKTITTYGDGRTEETSPVCITGATGRSVDRIEEWYYLSNKSNSLEGGTWSKTPPTWTDGKYIWTKNKIIYKNPSGSEETAPINNTGGSGQKGETGTDARTVRLNNVIHAVHFDQDGLMPSITSIAFPTAVQGFSGVTPHYEFKMGGTIVRGLSTASSWTLNTSDMKYSDFPLAVTVNVVIGGQTLATDTVTIVGTKPGEDAYTVVLANESHTFVGDVSNAMAGNTTANIIAYRGGTQVGATIGVISGLPTGMTSTVYSNGTTAARVTFTVTTSMTSPNGVVNIPVTVNGKTFTKVFNYAIAFKGAKGDKGTDGLAGKDGVGIRTTVLAYVSSTSGTTVPASGWATTVPTVAPGNYLWTRTTWTYTDNSVENGYTVSRIGKDGNTGSDGVAGKDGVGISKTVIHYAPSTNGTTAPTSGWITTVPGVAQGSYLWTRTTWTYTDGTNETGYSSARMGTDGSKGDKGASGENATARNYLLDSKPSSPITNSSYPTAFFLLAEKPVVGEIYTITIKGQLAATKTAFYAYNSGGSINLVSNIVHQGNGLYYKSFNWINSYSSGTAADDTSVYIYPFTSSQSGTSTIEWVSLVKGSVPLTEWVPAHEDFQSQINKSVKSTDVEYYLSTSSTGLAGGSWQTTAPAWVNGRFMWSRTKVVLNDGTTSYNPSATGTNITGATGNTGAPGSNGATGAPGKGVTSITEQYYLSTSKTGQSGGEWKTTAPTWSTGKYMWTRSMIVWNNPTSTTYSTPIVDSAWEAVNEIEIGGTNLIKGSATPRIMLPRNSGIDSDNFNFIQIQAPMKSGETYTLSFDAKITHGSFSSLDMYTQYGHTSTTRHSIVGGRVVATFTAVATTNAAITYIYAGISSATRGNGLIISNYKLEKGNKATDWSPAPEDLYQYVDDVEIGGTNLLKNSRTIYLSSNNTSLYPTSITQTEEEGRVFSRLRRTNLTLSPSVFSIFSTINIGDINQSILENEYTVVSFKARASQNVTMNTMGTTFGGSPLVTGTLGDINITTEWKTFYSIFPKIPKSASGFRVNPLSPITSVNMSTFYLDLCEYKIEKGNKVTGWSLSPEDVQSSIDLKADGTSTEEALNEAAAKLQVLQQEVEAAATADELKNFVAQYNKEQEALNADKTNSEKNLSDAMISIDAITNNMKDMSETWQFVDRSIRNTPQGIVIGNESSGSFIRINEQEIGFFSNGQRVAFVAQNVMQIDKGIFVEQIQVAKYQFEESTTNHLTIRYVG